MTETHPDGGRGNGDANSLDPALRAAFAGLAPATADQPSSPQQSGSDRRPVSPGARLVFEMSPETLREATKDLPEGTPDLERQLRLLSDLFGGGDTGPSQQTGSDHETAASARPVTHRTARPADTKRATGNSIG